ncbi:hypothetical protein A2U01_0092299, partial [Trifolium medium]|nr:hypothetical protein [Trifolium medium]
MSQRSGLMGKSWNRLDITKLPQDPLWE